MKVVICNRARAESSSFSTGFVTNMNLQEQAICRAQYLKGEL
jgi:hypothetical protein